jgi:hypothetical protein
MCLPTTGACDIAASAEAPVIAVEDITKNVQIPAKATNSGLKVAYYPASTIDQDFYLKFTLSGGAIWKSDAATDNMSLEYTPGGLDDAPATTGPSVAPDDPSTIFYYIGAKTNNVKNDGSFTFSFSVYDKSAVLSSSGSSIELSVSLELAANTAKKLDTAVGSQQVPILKSDEGQTVTISTTGMEAAKIDVTNDSLTFTLQNKSSNIAKLGEVSFTTSTSTMKAANVSDPWTFAADFVKAASVMIVSAPFNASIANGLVYIDNGDGVYDEADDFIATKVEADQATWTLDGTGAGDLVAACVGGCDIVVEVDAETSIEPLSEAPTAIVGIDYDSGYQKSLKKKLLHIKRNGAVCTLYNVIGEGGADLLSVRITNDSSREGIVWGTLRGMDGKALFTQEPLVGTADALFTDSLKPHQSVRITEKDLVKLAPTFAGKRGTLTLSSNIPADSMEVFGLVRNKNGGPLMNLSTGASSNGCED